MKTYDQNILDSILIVPASRTSVNSSWVQPFADGRGAERAVFKVVAGAVSGNDITAELWEAKDSNGTSARVMAGSQIIIPDASTGEQQTIEIGPNKLSQPNYDEDGNSEYTWVQLRVTSAGAQLFGAFYIRHELRDAGYYAQDETYPVALRLY